MAGIEIISGDAHADLLEFDRAAGSLSKAIAHAPRNREEREKVWRVSRAKRC